MAKRSRHTELRRAQRNLLALHGFKWRRVEADLKDTHGFWYIYKDRISFRDPHSWEMVSCEASVARVAEMIHTYKVNNDIEEDDP